MSNLVPPATDPGALAGLANGPVHLIGIGGVGMSGIARILRERGIAVSGSDTKASPTTDDLTRLGVRIAIGHAEENIAGARVVVASSAVRASNPERVAAAASGITVVHRSEALAALMLGRRAVAVAGTHGKTTTTSMITVALRACGLDPSFAIGGELTDSGLSAHEGTGDIFVAEADESDASFLRYRPTVAIITNVEADHLDHYGTLEAVEAAFDAFCDQIVPGGALVFCTDDPGARGVADRARARRGTSIEFLGYGCDPRAQVRLEALARRASGEARSAQTSGVTNGLLHLAGEAGPALALDLLVPGLHNLLNASAAFTAARWLGAEPDRVAQALGGFTGARRRFELKGSARGIEVRDDYSHHPTEVRAALAAARSVAGAGRVIAIFQPHLFSRTKFFAAEFAEALSGADVAIVLDVYAAREDPDPSVTGALISERIALPQGDVVFAPDAARALAAVLERAAPGDLVVTIGAGDVTALGPAVLAALDSLAKTDAPVAEHR